MDSEAVDEHPEARAEEGLLERERDRALLGQRREDSFGLRLAVALHEDQEIVALPQRASIAKHVDEEGKRKHEEMGFLDGWGTALDQLVALAKEL